MLDFKHFRHKHCTLDISNLCSLECPKCMRVQWKDKKKIPGKTMTVEQFKKIINYFKHIDFCGQISDPIFNPNFITFLSMCRDAEKSSTVHTAASQRPLSWYRIHQDGEKLFEAMKMGAKKGLQIEWQYIVFSYNEDHIQEAYEMAKDNNIQFVINYSGRWTDDQDPYKPRNSKFST